MQISEARLLPSFICAEGAFQIPTTDGIGFCRHKAQKKKQSLRKSLLAVSRMNRQTLLEKVDSN